MPKHYPNDETSLALMAKDIDYIKKEMVDIKNTVIEVKKNTESNFVTKAEFTPVKQIVYGIVGLVLTAVFGAVVSLVVIK